jgi:hypothetical protein
MAQRRAIRKPRPKPQINERFWRLRKRHNMTYQKLHAATKTPLAQLFSIEHYSHMPKQLDRRRAIAEALHTTEAYLWPEFYESNGDANGAEPTKDAC